MRNKAFLFPPAVSILLFAVWPTAASAWFIILPASLIAALVLYRREGKTTTEGIAKHEEVKKDTSSSKEEISNSTIGDVIDKPSLAAAIFILFYLIPMGVYRNRTALMWLIAMIIAPFIWFMLIIFPWSYFVLKGRKIAWETRKWKDLEEFRLCQGKWDLWAKGVAAAFLGIMIAVPFM